MLPFICCCVCFFLSSSSSAVWLMVKQFVWILNKFVPNAFCVRKHKRIKICEHCVGAHGQSPILNGGVYVCASKFVYGKWLIYGKW